MEVPFSTSQVIVTFAVLHAVVDDRYTVGMVGEYLFVQVGSTTGTGVDVGTGTGVDVGTGTGVDVGTGTGVDVGAVAVILAAIISWSIASKVARMSRSGVGVLGTTIFSEFDFDSSGKETQPITDKLRVIAMKKFLI